jgi:hypothetical protein
MMDMAAVFSGTHDARHSALNIKPVHWHEVSQRLAQVQSGFEESGRLCRGHVVNMQAYAKAE